MRLDSDILTVLAAAEVDGNVLRLTGQLDRALYVKVGKAIETAGGKWNRKAQAHIFNSDAAPIVAAMLGTESVTSERPERQFFETPPHIVDLLIARAGLSASDEVLEPSAGRGAIASRVAPMVAAVDCIEQHRAHAEVIHAAGYARNITVDDFLKVDPAPVYDRVIMNPPFAKGADVAHVAHALRFLRPGGLLVSVMPAGILTRQSRAAVALRYVAEDAGFSFEDLPDGAFRESGTDVKTVMALIASPAEAEPEMSGQGVLFADLKAS